MVQKSEAQSDAVMEEAQRQFKLIKSAYDHGLIADAAHLIKQALPEVFGVRVESFISGSSFRQQDKSLLTALKNRELQLLIIDRMTSAQLARRIDDYRCFDKQNNPISFDILSAFPEKDEVSLAIVKKFEGDDLTEKMAHKIGYFAASGYDSETRPNDAFIHGLTDHVIDNWPSNRIRYFMDNFIEGSHRLIGVIGEERARKLVERTPKDDIVNTPGWYRHLTTNDYKTYSGKAVKDHPVAKAMALMIQDKISGTLKEFIFSAPTVTGENSADVASRARQLYAERKLASHIKVVLERADPAEAMDVGRDTLKDCSTLLQRIVAENLEGLGSGLAAKSAMETVRGHLEVLKDLADGNRTIDVKKRQGISEWIAGHNPFSNRVPAAAIAEGYDEILKQISVAESASQTLIRAYAKLNESAPQIQDSLVQLEESLSGAVVAINQELKLDNVPKTRRANLEFIREIFEGKAEQTRVSGALVKVHQNVATDSTAAEVRFASALNALGTATNTSMTMTALAVTGMKGTAAKNLTAGARDLFVQSASAMTQHLTAMGQTFTDRQEIHQSHARQIARIKAVDASIVSSLTPQPVP